MLVSDCQGEQRVERPLVLKQGIAAFRRRTHLTRCLARMVFPARAIQELVGKDVSLSVEGGLRCEEGVCSLGAA